MLKSVIEQIKQGNLEELDKIYLEVKPKYIYFAKKAFPSLSIEEIEDTYHDSIIIFYQNIQRGLLSEITSSLNIYIIQIGKMLLIKLMEKKSKELKANQNYYENGEYETNYDHRIDDIVKFVFSKISDSSKRILHLFYFKKHSMEEIAEIMGYKNADVVKSTKNRSLTKLSEDVVQMYFKDEDGQG